MAGKGPISFSTAWFAVVTAVVLVVAGIIGALVDPEHWPIWVPVLAIGVVSLVVSIRVMRRRHPPGAGGTTPPPPDGTPPPQR